MKIGIVGLGLLGGSLAHALKLQSDTIEIVGFTGRDTTKKQAQDSGIFVDIFKYDEMNAQLDSIDILFLCSPIEVIKKHLIQISESKTLASHLIVTDIGSTKNEIACTSQELFFDRDDITFIGGHPMTGSEFSGFEASDAHIYENTIYLLTPAEDVKEDELSKLVGIIKLIGANPTIIDASKHDRVAALISHFPQIVATLMTDMVAKDGNMNEAKKLAAGGFRDMTRIASSGYPMWKDIFSSNRDVISQVIDLFIEKLKSVQYELGNDTLNEIFESAANFRDEIPKDMRGFLSPIWELVVQVPDKPGVLAKITNVLFEHEINIKDFSVVKIRETISGSVKLGFESDDDRNFAKKIIEDEGFKSTKVD